MVTCACAWLLTLAAQAQPELVLGWEAPAGCPNRASVEAALLRYLGASAVVGRADVHGTVRQGDGEFSLELSVRPEGGSIVERRLQANECADLAEATALLVALVVDPDLEPAPPGPGEEPSEEPPAAQDDPAPPTPERLSHRGFSLELAGIVDTAALVAVPSWGPRVTPGWRIGRLSVGLQLAGLFETAQQSDPYPEADVSSGLVLAAPELCFATDLGAWTLSTCAHLELGTTWLTTFGIESPSRAWDLWVAPGAEVRTQWWMRPNWSLDMGVGLIVPLRRSTFAIESDAGAVALHRAAPVGLRASLGVTYAAWP